MIESEGVLPTGWIRATLEEVTTPVEQRGPDGGASFWYIDISAIDNQRKEVIAAKQIDVADAPSRARQNVRAGDVLVSMTRPNLNAVAVVPDSLDGAVASTGFCVLRAAGVERNWLFLAVRSPAFVSAMTGLVQGALYPAVRPRDVRDYRIPVPPLAEQRRIVAKLDELLARSRAAREALGAVPALLKQYRQAIIAAAFQAGAARRDWDSVRLVDLIVPHRKIAYGVLKPGAHDAAGVRLLKSGQVREGFLDLSDDFRIRPELDAQFWRTRLSGGEVVLNLVGASIGRSAVVPPELAGANVSRAIAVIPVRPELAGWVQLALQGPAGQEMMRRATGGSAQPVLNLSEVREIPILMPPETERERRHALARHALARLDTVEETMTDLLRRLDALDVSALRKAFSGELVSQESSDELASMLLTGVKDDSPAARPRTRHRRTSSRR